MKKGVGCKLCLREIKDKLDCGFCGFVKKHQNLKECGLLNNEVTDVLLEKISKINADFDEVKAKALDVIGKVNGKELDGDDQECLKTIFQTE